MRESDIFDDLKQAEERADRRYHQGVIIQPGAMGDCILTLPLAMYMRETLRLQSLDIIGHSEYISILPGRTCIAKIRSLEAIPFHRLFVDHRQFDLDAHDPLITAFAPYEWVATFLGGEDSDFEKNLIYAANCTSGTEVTSIELKAEGAPPSHIAEYYIRQFIEKNREHLEPAEFDLSQQLITPARSDHKAGADILSAAGLEPGCTVVIQPGSSGDRKNWPLESFLAVATMLREEGLGAAMLLGPAEMAKYQGETLARLESTAPCFSGLILADVVGLLSESFAFLGNDSGITHLAGAAGVPTVAIFGATASAAYRPLGPRVATFDMPAEEFDRHDGGLCRSVVAQILNLPGR
jgi:heptosyltransferase III